MAQGDFQYLLYGKKILRKEQMFIIIGIAFLNLFFSIFKCFSMFFIEKNYKLLSTIDTNLKINPRTYIYNISSTYLYL